MKTVLDDPEETFARMVASGTTPQLAYSESRIGAIRACSVDQAMKLPGVAARIKFFQENATTPEARGEPPPEKAIDPANHTDEQVIDLLIRDHQLARSMGQVSAAVRAAELIGKQRGMFVDRSEQKIDVTHTIASRLDAAIKRLNPPTIDVTPKAVGTK